MSKKLEDKADKGKVDFGEILVNYDPEDGSSDSNDKDGEEEVEFDLAGDDEEGEGEGDEPDELELMREEMRRKDEVIANLSKTKVEAKPDADDPESTPVTEWKSEVFIPEDADIMDLTPAKLNQMLNTVAQRAFEAATDTAVSKTLLAIPDVVKHNVSVQSTIRQATKEFYDANEDLLEFKGAVAQVAQELAAENPEWELTKLFSQAGKETRRRLGIKKGKMPTKKPSVVRPRGQAGRAPEGNLQGLAKEINDMLDIS